MAKTAKPCATGATEAGKHPAYYQLHALLVTLREMSRHQDEICTLIEEIGRTGKMNAKLKRDLGEILETLHVESLTHEASTLRKTLAQAA